MMVVTNRQEVMEMPVYMVDRSLPGVTIDQLAAAQKAAIDTSKKFTAQGKSVGYIRSTFIPGESRCSGLVESSNGDLVKQVSQAAKIPFTRVSEAMELT